MFADGGVKVVSGSRFHGGYVGDENGGIEFVEKKIQSWIHCINLLVDAAQFQPQAAQFNFIVKIFAICKMLLVMCFGLACFVVRLLIERQIYFHCQVLQGD